MIRLHFKYDTIMPSIGYLSGTLKVEDRDIEVVSKKPIFLFECRFKKDNNTMGYSSIEGKKGIPTDLFNSIKPIIDSKIRAYWRGMLLKKESISWIMTGGEDGFDEVIKAKNCIEKLKGEIWRLQ